MDKDKRYIVFTTLLVVLVTSVAFTIIFPKGIDGTKQIDVEFENSTLQGLNSNYVDVHGVNGTNEYPIMMVGVLKKRNSSKINYGEIITTTNLSRINLSDTEEAKYQLFSSRESCELKPKYNHSKEENICVMCGQNQIQCYKNE